MKSEEGIELAAAVASAAAWSERLRKVLVRPRSSAGVHAIAVDDSKTALTLIVQSIRAATYDLEGTGEPPESEEGQFCLCRQPAGERCSAATCAGTGTISGARASPPGSREGAKNYVCQACLAAQGDVFKLNKPDVVYKHIHRTRRPTLTVLGEMLLEALEFSGKLPEEDLLVDVFVEHQKWRTAVAGVLKRRGATAGVEGIAQAAKEKADAAARALAAVRGRATRAHQGACTIAPRRCNKRRSARARPRWRPRCSAPAEAAPRLRRWKPRRDPRTWRRSSNSRCSGSKSPRRRR